MAVDGNRVFAGTQYYGVYFSKDNGTGWIQTSLNDRDVEALAVSGTNIYAGTWNGLYKSTDNGTSWTLIAMNNNNVNTLAVKGAYVYAGSGSAPAYGLYMSSDNGASWVQTSLNNRSVSSIAVAGNNIFAGTADYGVYFSADNGLTWSQTSLNNRSIYSLAVYGNNIFAGTRLSGVFVSNNNGMSWTSRNEGISATAINSLCISNNYIFAGSSAIKVYRRSLDELIGIQPVSSEIPRHYSLQQNYPNPFNPSTKIRFNIPLLRGVDAEGGRGVSTKLLIYDISGRLVETLVNKSLNPGVYEAQWPAPSGDAANYPSGVYFYKLQTETFSETRKMILMK
jgi:hypothetical protein